MMPKNRRAKIPITVSTTFISFSFFDSAIRCDIDVKLDWKSGLELDSFLILVVSDGDDVDDDDGCEIIVC